MTINEIESILETLETRHPNLDEVLLLTLLRAGGWDEKVIRDAVLLFRNSYGKPRSRVPPMFVPLQSDPVFPETADTAHTLLEHNPEEGEVILKKENEIVGVESPAIPPVLDETVKEVPKPQEEVIIPVPSVVPEVVLPLHEELIQKIPESEALEPQSLIPPTPPSSLPKKIEESEPPLDLPVKPFESTSHVWPFSRYKDVFHGEVMPLLKKEEEEVVKEHVTETIHFTHTPLTGKDEKLVLLACSMLLVVLLLLGYMYSNGRL